MHCKRNPSILFIFKKRDYLPLAHLGKGLTRPWRWDGGVYRSVSSPGVGVGVLRRGSPTTEAFY